MTTAPVLKRPTCGRDFEFVISTDASKYGIGVALLQTNSKGQLKPCAYLASHWQCHKDHTLHMIKNY